MGERLIMPAQEAVELYDEPCNNCKRWVRGAWCAKGHRQKRITITTGHIPELTFRKIGGCADHSMKVGTWWHEDPIKPHQSGYGGSSTNILL
jgi:hypothetical protein